MLSTSLTQEHSRERRPLVSPLRLGHLRRGKTMRATSLAAPPSDLGGRGGVIRGPGQPPNPPTHPPIHIKRIFLRKNKFYRRGLKLEVNFRYINFFWRLNHGGGGLPLSNDLVPTAPTAP